MRQRKIDKKKFIRFILVVTFIIALAIGVTISIRNISESVIKIGLYESSRPLTYVDERKNILGFEAEYARLLAEKLEKKPELKLYKLEEMADALNGGAVDLIISTRQSVHDYIDGAYETAPFISYGVVLVKSPDNDEIYGEEDIRGKRAGLIINSDADMLCDDMLQNYSFNVRLYDFELQPFQDLKLKKNDFVIADELFARYMQKEEPDYYQVLESVYYMADFGLRLSRKLSQQTVADIEDAVHSLRSELAVRALFLNWFGDDLGYNEKKISTPSHT